MAEIIAIPSGEQETWSFDQLTKSEFFHQKLHEWGMLETAYQIEEVRGETLDWDLEKLGISLKAWDKIIHRGIKPVVTFAHPQVLMSVPRAVGYYRMLALVSQKSMSRVGLPGTRYERENVFPDLQVALMIARHLNRLISHLVEADEQINAREFDLWRGMAAGSQAQGSWQNAKGHQTEIVVKGILQRRLREKRIVLEETADGQRMRLRDGREVIFANEPDIGIYSGAKVVAAVEIKGGIDTAGVLERVGAAIKSLSRAKEANPESVTVLILQGVSVTQRAIDDLRTNRNAVNHWFSVERLLEDQETREEFFRLLNV
ncbi:MAG: XcyI family restriction endonuclease [Anaerolineae bacterium]|nr:XcyI family restriction endonuclease [Anaerolineae bacterium]